jgi:hypothetical protein
MRGLLALGALLALSLPSCGGRHADLCDQAVDCAGGNDADYGACVEYLDAYEDVAAAHECDRQYDDYIECFQEQNNCVDIPATNDEILVHDDSCNDEADDLNDCIN